VLYACADSLGRISETNYEKVGRGEATIRAVGRAIDDTMSQSLSSECFGRCRAGAFHKTIDCVI
jgi:hypothetical protein